MVGSVRHLPFSCLTLGATAGSILFCNQGQNVKGLKIDVTFGVPAVSIIMWRVQNLMILKIQVAILLRNHYTLRTPSNVIQ